MGAVCPSGKMERVTRTDSNVVKDISAQQPHMGRGKVHANIHVWLKGTAVNTAVLVHIITRIIIRGNHQVQP